MPIKNIKFTRKSAGKKVYYHINIRNVSDTKIAWAIYWNSPVSRGYYKYNFNNKTEACSVAKALNDEVMINNVVSTARKTLPISIESTTIDIGGLY